LALLRYGAEEARNIAKAKKAAEQTARIEGSLAKRLATADVVSLQDQIDDKEPTISAGTSGQYWRGDKTWQTSRPALATIATLATDADATVTPTASVYQLFHTGTLTAGRVLTLTTAGMVSGYSMRVTRAGPGAFNLSVGGLKNLVSNSWCDVVFSGSAWVLTAYGTL